MTPAPGMRLGQRYELQSLIATGGMGQVWRGTDTTLDRPVAVKVLRSEFTGDATFLARFRAEARNTAALSHPNIAGIFDYGEADNGEHVAYLVMELVDGEPLSELLAREGRLSPQRTLSILGQAAAGLSAAHHAGVVHRDIKPGNLLVRPDGTVKVTDFGIARAASTVSLTQTGMVVGTAHYLPPEQAEGRVTTPASDVYSLGVVGFECLAGERPFDGASSVAVALKQIRELPPPLPGDVPGPVRALIEQAMDKDARRRFPTGGEFANAVQAIQEGRPIGPGPSSGPSMTTDVRTQVIGASPAGVALPAGAAAMGAAAAAAPPPLDRPQTQAFQGPVAPPRQPPAGRPPAPPPPPRRSNAGWWGLLVVALLVLAGVIGLVVAQNLSDSGNPGQTTTTTTQQTSAGEQTTANQTTDPTSESTTSQASTTAETTSEETTTTTATTTTTTTTTTTSQPEIVTVDAGEYRGQDVDSVVADLESLGLVADPVPVEDRRVNDGTIAEGTVGTVTPNGELEVGTTVTVPYAVPAPGNGNGGGGGDG